MKWTYWHKVTVTMVMGMSIYGALLYALSTQTQRHNQLAFAEKQKVVKQESALLSAFQEKQKTLLALQSKLKAEQQKTAKMDAQLLAVKQEISDFKSGHLPASVKLPTVSTPKATKTATAPVPTIQPPKVQSVTRASGT